MRLLIVDDDCELRGSLIEFLFIQGHTVHGAENGREAIEWFTNQRIYPGLILLDLVMPVLDGWGFLIERRAAPLIRRIPVIVMSGSPGSSSKGQSRGRCALYP
jgi:two-component system, chemotaxis family, chemotaxis protein CheY